MALNTKTGKVLLTAEELVDMASELVYIMNIIEISNIALEGVEIAQRYDKTTGLMLASKYFGAVHEQNQKIYDRLDKIAFFLFNNDDAVELGSKKHER